MLKFSTFQYEVIFVKMHFRYIDKNLVFEYTYSVGLNKLFLLFNIILFI